MTTHPSINDEVLDFLLSKPTPEAVIALRPSAAAQARLEFLLDHSRDGVLTDAERLELETYLRVEHFVRQLKIRAQERLSEGA